MRVIHRIARRVDPREERAVSIVIVAISLVAIFGMVVLTVDVGALLVKRRSMVNGADAAALAAAQSCVRATGDAEAQADTFADSNVTSTVSGGITDAPGCGQDVPGHVSVRYTTNQDLYFAPVLGFGDQEDVASEATAAWGPSGGANPVPIVLNLATFQGDCDIPNATKGQRCYLWYDNDRFDGSNFGFMNLDQWNVSTGFRCSSAGNSQRDDWIMGNWSGDPLKLNYPAPTYVCTDSGLAASAWSTLSQRIGDILTFPINDQSKQIMKSASQIDKYDIIGFAALQLDQVLTVQQAGSTSGSCSAKVSFPNASPIQLDAFGIAHRCFSSAPEQISSVTVTGKNVTSGMYTYNTATRTITWTGPQRSNVTVSFNWANTGPCGTPPNNASARCIVVSWQGYQFGGQGPNGGADFGLESIRLCALDIAGSCPQ
jgi:putative Flp pilus-assembly TadE/G-like protein